VVRFAADENLTHDVATLNRHAYDRIHEGLPMAGVCHLSRTVSISAILDDLLLILDVTTAEEWSGRIIFLPL
jgi:hypothetical protein